jgi:hypothetical protein
MTMPRAMVPKAKLTIPAVVAAIGRTSFGNWICLMSSPWRTIEVVASVIEAVNHFQGRIAAKMKSGNRGGVLDDDRQEDDVDDHLEQRVEDPPDVAEEGVRAALSDVRLDQVADEPAA